MTMLLASFSRCGAVGALVAAVLGCRGADASRESASTATVASTKPSVSLPALRSQVPVPPPLPGDLDPAPAPPVVLPGSHTETLGERLAREAAARPAGAPSAEQLAAALTAKGVSVARTRQVLAQTLGARYCAVALTARGVVASVCELDDAAAVATARRLSEQRFGTAMPNRRFVARGKSLLTIGNLSAGVDDEVSMIAATFAALPASE